MVWKPPALATMDNQIEKPAPKIQADNHSIAIGEINITDPVTGDITIGHTIVHRPACPCGCAADVLEVRVATLGCGHKILLHVILRSEATTLAPYASAGENLGFFLPATQNPDSSLRSE